MAFPLRSSEQSGFYPESAKNHAIEIARDWNVPAYGKGFVVCVDVRKDFLDHVDVSHTEEDAQQQFWVPLEYLEPFNASLVSRIKVSHRFPE